MAQRTATELRNYVYNNVKPNANNEITALIEQNLFLDFIDSFVITQSTSSGAIDVSQTSSNLVPTGANLNIPLIVTPKNGVTIILNGETFDLGETTNSKFYFKDSTGANVKLIGTLVYGDMLYYNSTSLGYLIDNLDSITLKYLVEV